MIVADIIPYYQPAAWQWSTILSTTNQKWTTMNGWIYLLTIMKHPYSMLWTKNMGSVNHHEPWLATLFPVHPPRHLVATSAEALCEPKILIATDLSLKHTYFIEHG